MNKVQEYIDKCVDEHATKDIYLNLFGFTMKINSKNPQHSDYVKLLGKMGRAVEIVDFVFEEKDKKGNPVPLHIHGVFKCDRNPYLKTVLPDGIHTKVERIWNLEGWKRYCSKNLSDFVKGSPKINNKIYLF